MAEMYKEFSYLQIPRSTQCLKLALHIFSWETIRINQKKIFEYVFKLIISIYSFIYYQIFIKEMNITMCFSPSAFKTLIDNAQSWLNYEEMSVVEVTPFPSQYKKYLHEIYDMKITDKCWIIIRAGIFLDRSENGGIVELLFRAS